MKETKTTEQVYGYHAVLSLAKTSPEEIEKVYLLDKRHDERIKQIKLILQKTNVHIITGRREELDQLTKNANHQGVVAIISGKVNFTKSWDLEEILKNCEKEEKKSLFLILDGVQDPHNLGACLRTADAAGVTAVIVPKDNAVGITPTVRKVASGAAETVPFLQVTNLARTIEILKKHNVWIYGTAAEANQTIFATDLSDNVALVLGAEGTGLRRLTKDLCDQLISIPMFGNVASLNVSVAAGICLYEVVRQR